MPYRQNKDMGVELEVLTGPERGRRLRAHRQSISIGRSQDNDLALGDDSTVSRYHATLAWRDPFWMLDDCRSKNGTYLDLEGASVRLVRPARLETGQRFSVGSAEIRFENVAVDPDSQANRTTLVPATVPPQMLRLKLQEDELHTELLIHGDIVEESRRRCLAGDIEALDRRLGQIASRIAHAQDRPPAPLPESPIEDLGRSIAETWWTRGLLDRLSHCNEPLVLSLDRPLTRIPWELSWIADTPMAIRMPVHRTVHEPEALRAAQPTPRHQEPLRALLISNPTEDLVELQDASESLFDELRKTFPDLCVEYLARKRATRAEVIEHGLRADIVYYAGHADFDPSSPEKCGWRLADGMMPLDRLCSRPDAPWLVFANACESARASAPSQTAATIAQAARATGDAYVLGALLPIRPRRGAGFALAFFHHLFRSLDPATALHHARKASREEFGPEDSTWASYALYSGSSPQHAGC